MAYVNDATAFPRVWSFGINDGFARETSDSIAKDFKAVGSFRADCASLSAKLGVVAHPALVPPRKHDSAGAAANDGSDMSTLSVQAALLDISGLEVLRRVMPSALHLKVLRLSSCHLDTEMLDLLRMGFCESTTSVHTLHLDWNPLELPLDTAQLKVLVDGGAAPSELDELEKNRGRLQAERTLRAVRDLILLRAQATETPSSNLTAEGEGEPDRATIDADLIRKVLQKAAKNAVPNFPATAMIEPLDIGTWVPTLANFAGIPAADAELTFCTLDNHSLGRGDGLVPLRRLEEVLLRLDPRGSAVEVAGSGAATDPLGAAFAGFLGAPNILEMVSFRACSIGHLEMVAMSHALSSSQHLRALNLWGNRICDNCCGLLAEALENYLGLAYLGLGRNVVTHIGLARFCNSLVKRVEVPKEADGIKKIIKDQNAQREKLLKKPPEPKKDGSGRERHVAPFHIDLLDERQDPTTGATYWLHFKNMNLKTLNLEDNPITDSSEVKRLQPLGAGHLILRGTRTAAELLEAAAAAAAETESAYASQAEAEATTEQIDVAPAEPSSGGESLGWRLVLK